MRKRMISRKALDGYFDDSKLIKRAKKHYAERNLTCLVCGFMTRNYEDMVKHLGHYRSYFKEERCNIRLIKMGKKDGTK